MTETIEFGSKAAADDFRAEFAEYICPIDDDKRLKTVAVVSETPEWLLEQARVQAGAGRAERAGGPGLAQLSEHEKDRVGPFDAPGEGPNQYGKASAVKALMRAEGVEDWTSFYDYKLTVDEHREVAEQALQDEQGDRLDAEDSTDEKLARAEKGVGERCDHAAGHCEHGDPDACEFLAEACGYSEAEIEAILAEDADGVEREQEISGPAAGALQRAWGAYKGGISRFDQDLQALAEAKRQAESAGAAINGIRASHGQEPLEFERLEELTDALEAAASGAHDHQGHVEFMERLS